LGAVLINEDTAPGTSSGVSNYDSVSFVIARRHTITAHDGLSPSPGWGRFLDSRGGELKYCWRIYPTRYRFIENRKSCDLFGLFIQTQMNCVIPGLVNRQLRQQPYRYVGDCKPGEESHSFMRDAVSSCLIFSDRASRSGPCGTPANCSSTRAFSAAIRSSNAWGTARRRCMTHLLLTDS
jgi:hypothetical protein